jgi:hypothetical protein
LYTLAASIIVPFTIRKDDTTVVLVLLTDEDVASSGKFIQAMAFFIVFSMFLVLCQPPLIKQLLEAYK